MINGTWLETRRKELGMTRSVLAERSSVSQYTIENIEKGKRIGSVETWTKLLSVVNDGTINLNDLESYLKTDKAKNHSEIIKDREWLIENRKRYDISQVQLADKLGVHLRTITNIEQGTRVGSVETWKKINRFFKQYNN